MKVTEQSQERRFILELGYKELWLIKYAMQFIADNHRFPHSSNYSRIAMSDEQGETLKALVKDIETTLLS